MRPHLPDASCFYVHGRHFGHGSHPWTAPLRTLSQPCMSPFRGPAGSVAWTAVVLASVFTAPACAQNPCPAEVPVPARAQLDADVLRVIEESPERTVGVLVVTSGPPGEAERRALTEAGLQIGVVAGDVVTGQIRACDAARLAGLSFVRVVQLARDVPRATPS
jgi:hypothetical protein